ncbi:Phosphatidylserine decarboxylase proenzyme [Tsuneonella dongtanensis]|uniref:Phosphatidylserine decarboxylase proenzyme n=1 Tax=Tsuneonella dongtanensis TaxID=692370 RepID=A0A1B2A9Q8_9SPHN|nr:archaetidylserine decarboxylase [Tsuneonella dongtanensis]ANY18841.1 Phosphatidylserine decarboxylase proenzyme [Tsuneonella dongtanensis]
MSQFFIRAQHIAPQHALSKLAGRFADSRVPAIRDPLIHRFAAAYGVDMDEAERPLGQYETFNDFFTRALKPGARPLADAATHVLSPADGAVSQIGRIAGGRVVQAKGRDYSVAELLGGNTEDAARFEGGRFATIYLSPKDYHRVHMPAAGALWQTIYVPGDLFSVNGVTAEGVDRLFARNERLVCLFDGEIGRFASVMVGAMIVAGIATVWGGRVKPHGREVIGENFADGPRFEAGDEMGRFFLGSTVVLLFEPGRIEWLEELGPGSVLRMGQAIATRTQ